MWSTNTLWFEVAIVSIIYAIGNIAFGHFEEQTPKWRRIAKYILTIIVIICLSLCFGRQVAMIVLSLFIIPFIYIHAYFLPGKKVSMVLPANQKAGTMISGNGIRIYSKKNNKRMQSCL